jgi:DNA-binding MarR family transcriptional regulator
MRAWISLIRAHDVTSRELGAQLQTNHALTRKDYEALYMLSEAEGQRLKRVDLSERLSLTPSGVTRLLEGLEADGFVERAACDSDLRVTYAALTDAGREKLEEASSAHVAAVRAVLEDCLTTDEIETLAELLDRLPGGPPPESCPAV